MFVRHFGNKKKHKSVTHRHKHTTKRPNMELDMRPFITVIEQNDFEICRKTLGEREPPCGSDVDKVVFLYEKRADIARLCRRHEKILHAQLDDPKRFGTISTPRFSYGTNKSFGIISEVPRMETRWRRFFNMDPKAPCAIICMEFNPRKTICANCTSVVCMDCRNRIREETCPCLYSET